MVESQSWHILMPTQQAEEGVCPAGTRETQNSLEEGSAGWKVQVAWAGLAAATRGRCCCSQGRTTKGTVRVCVCERNNYRNLRTSKGASPRPLAGRPYRLDRVSRKSWRPLLGIPLCKHPHCPPGSNSACGRRWQGETWKTGHSQCYNDDDGVCARACMCHLRGTCQTSCFSRLCLGLNIAWLLLILLSVKRVTEPRGSVWA